MNEAGSYGSCALNGGLMQGSCATSQRTLPSILYKMGRDRSMDSEGAAAV
jgi:hypothetical protein